MDGNTNHLSNQPCCSDATLLLDTDEFSWKASDKLVVESFDFDFLPAMFLILELNRNFTIGNLDFLRYSPPLIDRDITVIVQTFLI